MWPFESLGRQNEAMGLGGASSMSTVAGELARAFLDVRRRFAESEFGRNWPTVTVAFLLVFFAFGVPTYSYPFMYGAAMEEFGWSNAEAQLLNTAKFLMGAVAALGMGVLIDKVGGRWTVLAGAAVGGIAMA